MPELKVRRWPERKLLDQSSVAEMWAKEGLSCGLWVDPPGQSWLDFVHSSDERVIVKEGKPEFNVEGTTALLRPGDEVFIPAGSRHSVWNRGRTPARWFYAYRKRESSE